jgi:hypothetical protein
MKKQLTITATALYLLFGFITNSYALELLSYKDTNTGVTVISRQAVESAWASNEPACLKEGAKIVGVNNAFRSNNLGYRDCSNSAKRKRIHQAMAIKVNVFKLSELPTEMIKEIKSKK